MSRRSFEISVAGWSFHRRIFAGELKTIDAFRLVREELDLGAYELVNTLVEVPAAHYVARLAKQAEEYRVAIPLIMCDHEGHLGAADSTDRARAVRDHSKWVYIAGDLGCHAIRVNWIGLTDDDPNADAFLHRSTTSFQELLRIGEPSGVDILVENHGGPSSDPALLERLMESVSSPRFGTLPDFGNFPPGTDTYAAVDRMMPWAKAVSAKCYDFNADGTETTIDFERMLSICVDKHEYQGYIGIEYEGERLDEMAGTISCRDLLRRLRG